MEEPDFNIKGWFKMTEEQKDEMVDKLIEYGNETGEISILILSDIIIPQLLEEEEYEMIDVIKNIILKLKSRGKL